MSMYDPPDVTIVGAKRPCCAACAAAAKPAGFCVTPPGDKSHDGLNEKGEPGTMEAPCRPCSR